MIAGNGGPVAPFASARKGDGGVIRRGGAEAHGAQHLISRETAWRRCELHLWERGLGRSHPWMDRV